MLSLLTIFGSPFPFPSRMQGHQLVSQSWLADFGVLAGFLSFLLLLGWWTLRKKGDVPSPPVYLVVHFP